MGFTKNEPTQLAVQAAIEKAVKMLIIEGIQDQLWSTAEGQEKNKENDENFTRVSFDFRAMLYSDYEEHERADKKSVNANVRMILGEYYESI